MIAAQMIWHSPYLDLASGLFVPQLVTWDPETGEFTSVRGVEGILDVGGGGGGGEVSEAAGAGEGGLRVKRDMDLVRKLLILLEEKPDHVVTETVALEGYDDVTIGHHLIIMYEGGLIEGEPHVSTSSRRVIKVWPNRLTWDGYEFLSAARDESVWKKVKAKLVAGAGDVPIALLKELLTQTLRSQLGT